MGLSATQWLVMIVGMVAPTLIVLGVIGYGLVKRRSA